MGTRRDSGVFPFGNLLKIVASWEWPSGYKVRAVGRVGQRCFAIVRVKSCFCCCRIFAFANYYCYYHSSLLLSAVEH